ncbi:hypothetical protein CLOM_g22448 [Closterium sp. NIES-68]|nr:hypothetical protein CLOM_g22448 [Closterium sp. NIES-68]GJP70203.1 hypothetical protein CLOP_g1172 [Closterium sp. NIES-67]
MGSDGCFVVLPDSEGRAATSPASTRCEGATGGGATGGGSGVSSAGLRKPWGSSLSGVRLPAEPLSGASGLAAARPSCTPSPFDGRVGGAGIGGGVEQQGGGVGDVVVGLERMGVGEEEREEGRGGRGAEEGSWAKWPVNGATAVENGTAGVKNGFVHPYACAHHSRATTECACNESKSRPVTAATVAHQPTVLPRMNPLKPGKPVACVLGIGTANPDIVRPQGQFAKEYLQRINCYDKDTQAKFERICYHTGIDKRHMVLSWDTVAANPSLNQFGAPSLATRQAILRTEGVRLAAAACEHALAEWGGERAEITHLVAVTVSGVHLPGLDVQLVGALGLGRGTQRVLLQMLGCYAGVTALRVAKDLAENNVDEGARVLLVCSELNSLIFQAPHESLPDSLVCAAIFGDGAAAMVVGANPRSHAPQASHAPRTAGHQGLQAGSATEHTPQTPSQLPQQPPAAAPSSLPPSPSPAPPRPHETAIFEIVRVAEFFLPDTTRHIAGDLTEAGLLVHLRREVPLLLPGPVKEFSENLLGQAGVGFAESFWAVHPGGRAILDGLQRQLGLKKSALRASREVLRQYGNMSSGSVLFVLDEIRRKNKRSEPQWGVALGFGPGVTVEGALMRLL